MKNFGRVQKIVIASVGFIGLMGIALVAPQVLQVLSIHTQFSKKKYIEKQRYIDHKIIKKLVKEKILEIKFSKGKEFVSLTSKGKNIAKQIEQGTISIKKPKKWDKKWRVIIFDIKEFQRKARDKFRRELMNLGFVQLQRSVWAYPYPCDSLIKIFKADLRVGKDILYMKVEAIENDGWLKREFDLI